MQRVLRAISGLPLGATFVVGDRLTLGRAPDNDVQLMDTGVSRRHAKIEIDRDGAVMLIDLSSRGGTIVDGTLVERTLLRHGSVIAIGHFVMRFEEATEVALLPSRGPRRAGLETIRVTGEFERIGGRIVHVDAFAGARRPTPRPTEPPRAAPAPAAPIAPTVLLRAIHELRLRTAHREGRAASPFDDGPVRSVLLAGDRAPGRRTHPRFPCTIQAWLARKDGTRVTTAPIDLGDVSAGGARFTWRGAAIDLSGAQWLVVDLDEDDDAPILVFAARVAWTMHRSRAAGLELIGTGARGLDALELVRDAAAHP